MTAEDYQRFVKLGGKAQEHLFKAPDRGNPVDSFALAKTASGWAADAVLEMDDAEAAWIAVAGLDGQVREMDEILDNLDKTPLAGKQDEQEMQAHFRQELRGIAEGVRQIRSLATKALADRSFGRVAFLTFQGASAANLFFGMTDRWGMTVGNAREATRKRRPRRAKKTSVTAGEVWNAVRLEWEKSDRTLSAKDALPVFENAGGSQMRSIQSFESAYSTRKKRWSKNNLT